MNAGSVRIKSIIKGCTHSQRILCNLGKREQFARIMNNIERYKNLYFCDCA